MTAIKNTSKATKTIYAENKFNVYSNHTGVMTSNYDFKFVFGSIESATDSGLIILEHGSVTMSPQHAKAFCSHLSNAIASYETSFGEIKLTNKPTE